MNKVLLIIRREYLTRVNKKSFIILTFLSPIFFAALIFVPIWLATIKSDEQKVFAIIDETGKYGSVFQNTDEYIFRYQFEKSNQPGQLEDKAKEIFAFIVITDDLLNNPNAATIYSEKAISSGEKNMIQTALEKYSENEKLASFNIPNIKEIIQQSQIKINVGTQKIEKDGSVKETSSEIVGIISLFGAFLIYMFIFMYGSQIMYSVSEEKNNRIVEVIISSVKPFRLMTGKIIGTALVGLTQFFLWIIFTGLIVFVLNLGLGFDLSSSTANVPAQISDINALSANNEINSMIGALLNINWGTLFFCFIVYFLGGYLLYSSFFAAIGAAIDTSSDAQQFVLPISVPLIFALYLAIYGIQNPDGPLLYWCSFIPFTAPVAMMARIPFDVPVWELLLSMSILIASFIVFARISGKIYKIGILMYGKKAGYREILKWIKYTK